MKVLVLNGPNLARLGTREPDIYGATTWPQLQQRVTADEGVPVVLNPAAFTHYSYGLRDAAAQLRAPLIEVHISNPAAREEFRHTSVIAALATGTIAGFGITSYLLAVDAVLALGCE